MKLSWKATAGFVAFLIRKGKLKLSKLLNDFSKASGSPLHKFSIRSDIFVDRWNNFTFGDNCTFESGLKVSSPTNPEESGRLVVGDGVYIGRNCMIELPSDGNVVLGDQVSMNSNCHICGNVQIGRYTLLGPDVFVSSGKHNFREGGAKLIRAQDAIYHSDEPVSIEEDVWIGKGALIRSGVQIGRGAIIGANSVVIKNVAPYTVFAGVPAVQIGTRLTFSPGGVVDCSEPQQMQYFYSGFFHAPTSNEVDAKQLRGVLAGRESIVVMRGGEFETLRIQGSTVAPSVLELTLHCGISVCAVKSEVSDHFDITLRDFEKTILKSPKFPLLSEWTAVEIRVMNRGGMIDFPRFLEPTPVLSVHRLAIA